MSDPDGGPEPSASAAGTPSGDPSSGPPSVSSAPSAPSASSPAVDDAGVGSDADRNADRDDGAGPDAGSGDGPFGSRSPLDRLRDRGVDPAAAGVLAVTALALLLRTVGLGERIFHWDEGRVGYWILRFDATGEFFYRPIIHGPFLPVVNNALFDVVGASDFAARLPVAVVGGLLPLAALALRHRLRGREQVALALLLAVDPLLVYYGRFMRGDVLVGSFCVAAFALVVFAIDERRTLPLFGAAALLALGFAAKENALVYLACFAGASALILDHRIVRSASRTGSPLDAAVGELVALRHYLDGWTAGSRTRTGIERAVRRRRDDAPWAPEAGFLGHLAIWVPVGALGVAGTFLATIVFFYAPRPDLWQALGVAGAPEPPAPPAPTVSTVIEEATVGAGEKFWETWASGTHSGHAYMPFLHDVLETLAYGSGVLVVLALVGFLADGYGEERGTRPIVAFATYWGVASLIGYPVATDIQAPWAAVHVVLPLAIPAAIGAGHVADSVRVGVARGDVATAGLAALVVLASLSGVAAANADYWNSAAEEDKQVLQWAQPENAYKEALLDAGAVARTHEGTDVLFVGTESPGGSVRFYVSDEQSVRRMPPGGPSWHSRLPTPWYLELAGAEVTSTPPDARFDGLPAGEEMPPVVIAKSWDREELAERLDGYAVREFKYRLWGEYVVVFIDRSALRNAYELEGGEPASAAAADPEPPHGRAHFVGR